MNARDLAWLVCLPLLGAALTAHAQEPLRATIVQVDRDDVVIDVGAAQLTPATQQLTVYRPLEVRHPITGKKLRDRFAIGTVRIVQPGEKLSIARASSPPTHPFQVGDVVEAAAASRVAPAPAPPPITPPAATTPPPAVAALPASAPPPVASATLTPAEQQIIATDRVLVLHWRATLNQPPTERIRIYKAYLESHPDSAYRAALLSEIQYLRDVDSALRTRTSVNNATAAYARTAPAEAKDEAPELIEMAPLTGAEAGRPLELAALVRASRVRAVLLHVRALDAHGYRSQPMLLDARGHARARVAPQAVHAPGIAYFVELVGEDGRTYPAIGTATEPRIAVVRGPAPEPPHHERTVRVKASSEIASFDGTSGRDYFFINEGDFLYRLRRGALYGIRIGYGTLHGEGGTVEQLDELKLDPQPAGFSYGFFEAELELHRLFGVAGRGTIGLGRPDDPTSQRSGVTGGFQLRARIGEADGTHLNLAGEIMPEIGQRAYLGLAWEAIERLPMATEIVVTDQPVNSDELAVRLIYEVGYRFSDQVSVALRPSYQLRTIRHAGPGIGMAATFDW